MKRLQAIVIVIAFVMSKSSFAAAWLQKAGELQTIYGINSGGSGNDLANLRKDSSDSKIYNKSLYNIYGEYGVTDRATIGGAINYQELTVGGIDAKSASAQLLARHQIGISQNSTFSFQLSGQAPLVTMASEFKDFNYSDSKYSIEPRLLMGYSFNFGQGKIGNSVAYAGQWHFVSIELAYRKIFSSFFDQIKFDSTLGIRANKYSIILLQTFITHNLLIKNKLYNARNPIAESGTKLMASNAIQISPYHSLQLGIYRGFYSQNNETGLFINVWQAIDW